MKNMKLLLVMILALTMVFAFGAIAMAAEGEEEVQLKDEPTTLVETPAEGEEATEEPAAEEPAAEEEVIAPAETPAFTKCQVSSQAIKVNGVETAFDVYNIDGYNYFKLRDLAAALSATASKFSVAWDAEKSLVTAVAGGDYEKQEGDMVVGEDKSATCKVSTHAALFNGEASTAWAYNIGGNNYFKLADLATVFGFTAEYDEETRTVMINSSDYVPTEVPAAETPAPATEFGKLTIKEVDYVVDKAGEAAEGKNHKEEAFTYVGFAFSELYTGEIADDAAVTVECADGYKGECTGAQLKAAIIFTEYDGEAGFGIIIAGKNYKDASIITW